MTLKPEQVIPEFGPPFFDILRAALNRRPVESFIAWQFPDLGMPTIRTGLSNWWVYLNTLLNEVPEALELLDTLGESLWHHYYHRQLPMTDHKGNQLEHLMYEQADWVMLTDVVGILANYLQEHGPVFDADAFMETTQKYRASWQLEAIPLETVIPLLRFSTQTDVPIEIGHVRIEPLTGQRKTRMYSKGSWEAMRLPPSDIASAGYAIHSVSDVSRLDRTTHQPEAIATTVRSIVTALRLLHGGDVAAPAGTWYVGEAVMEPSADVRWGDLRFEEFEPSAGGPDYTLAATDVEPLRLLTQKIQTLRDTGMLKQLNIPLRRFNLSYSRSHPDDALVDLVVALESSVLAHLDDRNELRYRMGLRGAAILASTRPPEETLKFLRNTYDIRSKIVHSGISLYDLAAKQDKLMKAYWDSKRSLHDYVEDVRQHVRDVLRAYLDRLSPQHTMKRINENLDRTIVASIREEK